jgi:hypothetical protein
MGTSPSNHPSGIDNKYNYNAMERIVRRPFLTLLHALYRWSDTADQIIPRTLIGMILERVPYPDHRETRTVNLHAADLPTTADTLISADHRRLCNLYSLKLETGDGTTLGPENERALDRLMTNLDGLKVLFVTGGLQTAQVWNRILSVLSRVETLWISEDVMFGRGDTQLHQRIAETLLLMPQLTQLQPGTLQTDLPLGGHPYNLDAIADAIVSRGRWDYLILDVVPNGVWRNRRPRASVINLIIHRDCTHADINWNWFCSHEAAKEKLCISGNYGDNLFPVDNRPVSFVNCKVSMLMNYPYVCTTGTRRFIQNLGDNLCIRFIVSSCGQINVIRLSECIRNLQSDNISSFQILFRETSPPTDGKVIRTTQAITALMRHIIHANDRLHSLRLIVVVSTDAISPLTKALLESESVDVLWGAWFRNKTVHITDN